MKDVGDTKLKKQLDKIIFLTAYLTHSGKVAKSLSVAKKHVSKCKKCQDWIRETELADAMYLNLQALGSRKN